MFSILLLYMLKVKKDGKYHQQKKVLSKNRVPKMVYGFQKQGVQNGCET